MTNITYTFPLDCPSAQLRGITVSGGEFIRIDGKWQNAVDGVRFLDWIEGKQVIARIAGKPELESALAAHYAKQKAIVDRLAAIGWPQYEKVLRRVSNAREDYESASEYGYPIKEGAALRTAEAALAVAILKYPIAAAYARAESYSMAAHDQKSSAGRAAMAEIEAGADPIAAIEKMEIDWTAAAEKSVLNS